MSIKAMKQALEALETLNSGDTYKTHNAATTLRAAIEQAEKQEPVAWKNAAMRIGEDLSSVGPDGYYDMNAEQWLDWAIKQEPRGKTSLPPLYTKEQTMDIAQKLADSALLNSAPPQRKKQEPVAWADKYDIEREGHDFYVNRQQPAKDGVPLYTAPPQRSWQGLTDEEVRAFEVWLDDEEEKHGWNPPQDIIKYIEAKLKEKNNG